MKKYSKYLITFGIGLLIALIIIIYRDTFNETDTKEVFRSLCDAFFVSTICIGGIGLLVFASSEGAFDMLSYGMSSFINLIKGNGKNKYSSYFDYKESKAKNKVESGFILYVGLFLLIITIILYIIYSKL